MLSIMAYTLYLHNPTDNLIVILIYSLNYQVSTQGVILGNPLHRNFNKILNNMFFLD